MSILYGLKISPQVAGAGATPPTGAAGAAPATTYTAPPPNVSYGIQGGFSIDAYKTEGCIDPGVSGSLKVGGFFAYRPEFWDRLSFMFDLNGVARFLPGIDNIRKNRGKNCKDEGAGAPVPQPTGTPPKDPGVGQIKDPEPPKPEDEKNPTIGGGGGLDEGFGTPPVEPPTGEESEETSTTGNEGEDTNPSPKGPPVSSIDAQSVEAAINKIDLTYAIGIESRLGLGIDVFREQGTDTAAPDNIRLSAGLVLLDSENIIDTDRAGGGYDDRRIYEARKQTSGALDGEFTFVPAATASWGHFDLTLEASLWRDTTIDGINKVEGKKGREITERQRTNEFGLTAGWNFGFKPPKTPPPPAAGPERPANATCNSFDDNILVPDAEKDSAGKKLTIEAYLAKLNDETLTNNDAVKAYLKACSQEDLTSKLEFVVRAIPVGDLSNPTLERRIVLINKDTKEVVYDKDGYRETTVDGSGNHVPTPKLVPLTDIKLKALAAAVTQVPINEIAEITGTHLQLGFDRPSDKEVAAFKAVLADYEKLSDAEKETQRDAFLRRLAELAQVEGKTLSSEDKKRNKKLSPGEKIKPGPMIQYYDGTTKKGFDEAQKRIHAAAQKIGEAGLSIAIDIYRDRSGSTKYNKGLSDRAAQMAEIYMTIAGVNVVRATGRGEVAALNSEGQATLSTHNAEGNALRERDLRKDAGDTYIKDSNQNSDVKFRIFDIKLVNATGQEVDVATFKKEVDATPRYRTMWQDATYRVSTNISKLKGVTYFGEQPDAKKECDIVRVPFEYKDAYGHSMGLGYASGAPESDIAPQKDAPAKVELAEQPNTIDGFDASVEDLVGGITDDASKTTLGGLSQALIIKLDDDKTEITKITTVDASTLENSKQMLAVVLKDLTEAKQFLDRLAKAIATVPDTDPYEAKLTLAKTQVEKAITALATALTELGNKTSTFSKTNLTTAIEDYKKSYPSITLTKGTTLNIGTDGTMSIPFTAGTGNAASFEKLPEKKPYVFALLKEGERVSLIPLLGVKVEGTNLKVNVPKRLKDKVVDLLITGGQAKLDLTQKQLATGEELTLKSPPPPKRKGHR